LGRRLSAISAFRSPVRLRNEVPDLPSYRAILKGGGTLDKPPQFFRQRHADLLFLGHSSASVFVAEHAPASSRRNALRFADGPRAKEHCLAHQ
jgi:hypothetical protein